MLALILSKETSKSQPLQKYWNIFIYILPLIIGGYLLIDVILFSSKLVVRQGEIFFLILFIEYFALLTVLMIKYNIQ